MSQGTIQVSYNSDQIIGTGTLFLTDIVVGDMFTYKTGNVVYTATVKSVQSDTSLTTITKHLGPSASSLAYSVLPSEMVMEISAQLAQSTEYIMRGFILDKSNWQLILTSDNDVTVTLPDYSTFTGPSWKKVINILNSIDSDLLITIGQQVAIDAAQVATDRADVDSKAATVATQSAQVATSATQVAADRIAVHDDRVLAEEARDAALQANPALQLTKSANLSDVADVATARSNIGAAAKGANSDITSITGLTTPLSLGQGGVGATTQAGARDTLGVPAGATQQMVSAWVSFNGSNGIMNGGYGVSSVTRNSPGNYTVNFITPLTTNYAAIALATAGSGAGVATGQCGMISAGLNSATFVTFSNGFSQVDSAAVYFAVVGGRS